MSREACRWCFGLSYFVYYPLSIDTFRFDLHLAVQAEGIFRINGDNGQQESTREQLNMGLVPNNIDVHSLACLIKVVLAT